MKKLVLSTLVISLLVLSACEEQNPTPESFSSYSNGVFVVNEGGFQKNNGSLSFYSNDSNKMINHVFMAANNTSNTPDSLKVSIGDIFQSMTIIDDEVYLVANNSQKVSIASLKDLTLVTTIDDLSYPRFVLKGKGNIAYISNGNGFGNDAVYVLNTMSHQIIDTIPVGKGPEQMLMLGNNLYVACIGGHSTDNRVFVINVNTNKVVKIIKTADRPGDFVVDKNNDIWVLAAGATLYDASWNVIGSTNAKLSKIDNSSMEVTDSLELNGSLNGFGSNFLAISKDGISLFFRNNDIIKVSITDKTQSVLIPNAGWYGFDVDPKTGYIWGFESIFGSNGKAEIYSETGNKLNEFEVGEGPNGAVFIN